jgi:hypothetical protein
MPSPSVAFTSAPLASQNSATAFCRPRRPCAAASPRRRFQAHERRLCFDEALHPGQIALSGGGVDRGGEKVVADSRTAAVAPSRVRFMIRSFLPREVLDVVSIVSCRGGLPVAEGARR